MSEMKAEADSKSVFGEIVKANQRISGG